ncbi:MAG TPA: hypothetical protein VHS59_12190 [Bacillota bacterium]|nr:hypothetical protein [Bacillota bacterium]
MKPISLRSGHKIFFSTRWQIAATYIGTVVGAGFASGQEILQFFAAFGGWGLAGILAASLGFSILGAYILVLGFKVQASSHQPLFSLICGKIPGKLVDLVVTLFLFMSMVVMLAGVGAISREHLGLPETWGIAATLIVALITVLFGLQGVMTANSLIIPLMVILTIGISCYSLNYHGFVLSDLSRTAPQLAITGNWLLAAVLYLSYNLILAVPVLGPMGSHPPNLPFLISGGLIGGVVLGLLSLLQALVLMAHFPAVTQYQIPMLYIVRPYASVFRLLYALILWGEIFTTLISCVFGFAQRLTALGGVTFRQLAVGSLFVAALFSRIGFSTLVGTVYPLVGYAGLIFVLGLVYRLVSHGAKSETL